MGAAPTIACKKMRKGNGAPASRRQDTATIAQSDKRLLVAGETAGQVYFTDAASFIELPGATS